MAQSSSSYSGLSRAQLSYEYLHTNSTTHEFLFGALAELVDNSRDAAASRLDIFTVEDKSLRGGNMLCFLDDGEGMDPQETSNVITFGRSIKKGTDSKLIGQYGNGLKSGSMRIGNDVIVFTKKETTMTCLMLSRTFHEEEKIKEVIVPLPSFQVQNLAPLLESNRKGKNRHEVEMNLILKYSPFKTRDEFFNQFRLIKGNSGTLVIVYNLKLLDNGDPELNFETKDDICLSGIDLKTDKKLVPERYSFRAYIAILYSEPRMQIYLQKKKAQAHRFIFSLFQPRCYHYTSARFKARSQEDAKNADQEYRNAISKLRDAEGQARQLEKNMLTASASLNKELRTKLRATQNLAADLQKEVELKKSNVDRKQRALKEPKTLTFIFGVNLENRNCDGLFIYNCNRLIKMYERVGSQLEGRRKCGGIIGIIDIPYIVLEPTHNKQDFADAKEYRHLLKTLGEYMDHYWKENIERTNMDAFWETYGYHTRKWDEKPSMDQKYLNQRARQKKVSIQCDTCLKWRILPFSSKNIGKVFPDDWTCSHNPDSSRNRCSTTEDKLLIPEGKFQRAEKSRTEKADQVAGAINKLNVKLNTIRREETVESSRNVDAVMARASKKNLGRIPRRTSVLDDDITSGPSTSFEELSPRIYNSPREEWPLRNYSSPFEDRNQRNYHSPRDEVIPSRPSVIREDRSQRRESSSSQDERVRQRRTSSSSQEERVPRKQTFRPSLNQGVRRTSSSSQEKRQNSSGANVRKAPSSTTTAHRVPTTRKRSQRPAPGTQNVDRDFIDLELTESEKEDGDELTHSSPVVSISPTSSVSQTTFSPRKSPAHPSRHSEPPAKVRRNRIMSDVTTDELSSWDDDSDDGQSLEKYVEGARVEVKIKNKWRTGVVVNKIGDKAQIKFDKRPHDRFDKRISVTSDILKLAPANVEIGTVQHELPSSSTIFPVSQLTNDQMIESLTCGFRSCLRYFLPPDWMMDRNVMNALTANDLVNFPFNDFYEQYEKGLNDLVNNRVEAAVAECGKELENQRLETEKYQNDLDRNNQLIARLLNSIHDDCNLDPTNDSDKVQELLLACVVQAELPNGGNPEFNW